MGTYIATFDDKYKHTYISIPYVHRSAVPQFPASPIFSLQIDPLPDAATLKSSPIMMMFDVVGHCTIHKSQYSHVLSLTEIILLFTSWLLIRAKYHSKSAKF